MNEKHLLIMRGSSQYVNPLFYNVQEIGLGKALNKYGWNINVVSSGPTYQHIRINDALNWFELPRIGSTFGWPKGGYSYLNNLRADIIQNQDISNTGILISLAAAKKRKLPLVMSLGEYRPKSKSKALYMKTISNLISPTVKGVLCKTQEAVAFSDSLKLGPSFYAPIGIDPDAYDQEEEQGETIFLEEIEKVRREGKFVLAHVGRLDKEDNFEFLCNVLKRIERPVHLFIAGAFTAVEQAKVVQEGLTEKISLLGKVENRKIGHLLSNSDLLLSCSTYEPFGMSAAESVYHGCPVLGYRTGGLGEIVKDGVTGILLKNRDSTVWAKTIDELTSNIWQGLKLSCQENKQELTWLAKAKRFNEVYEAIIKAGG
ncbi:glycosyltransferase [Paenibacillus pasadenensis]|uniref:glycosyltransferase n=1 Tax=Paenibacillus pasadenensis TaxID=217090 RepID=UPI000C7B152B|nr:glycosyltransferase [Paenibacillus pasadenensis]